MTMNNTKPDPTALSKLKRAEAAGKKLSNIPRRLLYATRYHQTKRGQFLNFTQRKWLLDLYLKIQVKPGAQTVIRKCVQCGISEFLVLDTLFTAAELGLWTMYALPTKDLRNRFVRMRVDPVIAASEWYQKKQMEAVGTVDGVGSKFFGQGAIVFVGSNSPNEFIEFSADRVVIDEYDRCNRENLNLATDRYAGSKWKILYKVGNPTTENFGVSLEYKTNSTKKDWQISCNHCKKYQPMDWFKNFVTQVGNYQYDILDTKWTKGCGRDVHPICIYCGKLMDRFGKGEWVAEHPDKEVDGYTISQLYSPNTDIERLLFHAHDGFYRAITDQGKLGSFFNGQLGMPYSPPGSSLTLDVLADCTKNFNVGEDTINQTTMGVDVGKVLHVVISDHPYGEDRQYRRLRYAKTCSSFEELDILMAKYKVSCCVVDAFPETREAKRFQQRHPGQVWLCQFYRTDNVQEPKLNDKDRIVQVDRTQTMDSMVSQFMDQTRLLPADAATIDKGDYFDQLTAPERIMDADSGKYRWDEGDKPDHYFLAETYDFTAKTLLDKGVNACLALSDYNPKGYFQESVRYRLERETITLWLLDKEISPEKQAELDQQKKALEEYDSKPIKKLY